MVLPKAAIKGHVAFTAEFCGGSAVVCLVFEDRPEPVTRHKNREAYRSQTGAGQKARRSEQGKNQGKYSPDDWNSSRDSLHTAIGA